MLRMTAKLCISVLILFVASVRPTPPDATILSPGIYTDSSNGNEFIHRGHMEMYSKDNHNYVRVYVAVFKDINQDNSSIHKDVWQDNNHKIIIHSSKGKIFMSFGQAQRPVAFAEKYKREDTKADPVVRSFLADANIINEISENARGEQDRGGVKSVDLRYSANQFGLIKNAVDELQGAALKGSLISWTETPQDRPAHWGSVQPLTRLREKYALADPKYSAGEFDPVFKQKKKKFYFMTHKDINERLIKFRFHYNMYKNVYNGAQMKASNVIEGDRIIMKALAFDQVFYQHFEPVAPTPPPTDNMTENEQMQKVNNFFEEYKNLTRKDNITLERFYEELVSQWIKQMTGPAELGNSVHKIIQRINNTQEIENLSNEIREAFITANPVADYKPLLKADKHSPDDDTGSSAHSPNFWSRLWARLRAFFG